KDWFHGSRFPDENLTAGYRPGSGSQRMPNPPRIVQHIAPTNLEGIGARQRPQQNCGTMEQMSQAQGIRVARILGIPIFIDFSWILVFGLIAFFISENFGAQY